MKPPVSGLLALGMAAHSISVGAAAPTGATPPVATSINPSTHSSPLSQVDRHNVGRLRPVFTFRTGRLGAQGSAPLVWGTKLVLLSSFPHTLFAIDLTRPDGSLSWQFTPAANRAADGLRCCDRRHLGPVASDERIYFSTLDGHVIAMEPSSGRPVWDAAVADPARGETLASAPILTAGRLIVGNAGDDFGVRGWIAALDARDGHQLWKHYTTGPDQDVGISKRFEPARPQSRGQDLGSHSWAGDGWRRGGGSVAGEMLYDAHLSLVFHNTGPPAPWNPEPRPGDNRWTSGVFARDLLTGEARWFTGLHPHSLFAWRNGNANLMVDRPWGGSTRSLLIHADSDGQVYVLDRSTGEVLSAAAFTQTSTGKTRSADGTPKANLQVRGICPAWVGAVGGDPAFSEETGWLYLPVSHLCMDMEARSANYMQGTAFIGANVRVEDGGDGPPGGLIAWDLAAHKAVWRVPEAFPVVSDVLTTAGGLVFYGTLDGSFKALDAHTGALLWQYKTSAAIMSQPTTYQGPDGRQYIAVVAGPSGPYGLAQQAWIDRRDATAARGLARVVAHAPAPRDPSGTLYVFSLP